jgi:hypothetical protein
MTEIKTEMGASPGGIGGLDVVMRLMDEWFRRGDTMRVGAMSRRFEPEFNASRTPEFVERYEAMRRNLVVAKEFEVDHGIGSFLDLTDDYVQKSMSGEYATYSPEMLSNAACYRTERRMLFQNLKEATT